MKHLALAALAVLVPATVSPGENPTVQELIRRHVEALGGPAALGRLTSRVAKGTTTVVERGAVGPTTIYQKAPAKYLLVTEFAIGAVRRGFDGERAWSESPESGLVDVTGSRLAQMRRQAQFDLDARLETLYPGLVVAGKETLDGVSVWAARSGTAEESDTLFFDAGTGLLVGTVHEEATPRGPLKVEVRYRDFRSVDGVKVAFATILQTPRLKLETKLSEVKHNQRIDDALFAKPSPTE